MLAPHDQFLPPGVIVKRLIAPLPLWPLTVTLSHLVDRLMQRNQTVMARLVAISGTKFAITARDIGLTFHVVINESTILVRTARTPDPDAHVTIDGTIKQLVALLEGEIDGDALFFSRDLAVAGNTESLLTLRNAIDSANIDLRQEILSLLSPFDNIADHGLSAVVPLFKGIEREMASLRQSLVSGVNTKVDILTEKITKQAAGIEQLVRRVDRLERKKKPGTDHNRSAIETTL